jgi:hypothetical protein
VGVPLSLFRTCGICKITDIPRGVDWPWWRKGEPAHATCYAKSVDDVLREPPLCAGGCGMNAHFCVCPPVVPVNRPSWRDTYPPLYCMICAAPMYGVTPQRKAMAPQMTCSPECLSEFDRRYANGTVLEKPYERKP